LAHRVVPEAVGGRVKRIPLVAAAAREHREL